MLRRLSLLMLLPLSSLFAQAPGNVRVTIGDSTGLERYQIIHSGIPATGPLPTATIHGAGTAVLLAGRDSGSVTIVTDDPARPVHVSVANGTSTLRAVGAMVMVHVLGDSVSIEARDRSFLTPSAQRRP